MPGPDPSPLSVVDGYSFDLEVTPGAETRARLLGARVERALGWLERTTGKRIETRVYVVGPEHWDLVAEIPLYGMPMSFPGKVVAPLTAAPWMTDYVTTISSNLDEQAKSNLQGALGTQEAVTALVDLVLVHELTHLVEEFDQVTGEGEFPALWLSELFANIGMYGYLADEEPDELERLMLLARSTLEAGNDIWPATTLSTMGDTFAHGPEHYVRFQMLLILVARKLWDGGSAEGMRKFKRALVKRSLDEDQVLRTIAEIELDAADMLRRWPDV